MDQPPLVPVKDLRPGLKNLTMVLITLEIGKPSTTKDGHEVRSIRVADRTGSVNLSIWDEPGTLLQPGDIVRVHKAYASLFKNSLTLYIGKGGEIYKVGDFCLHFSETPNMSEEPFTNPAAGGGGAGGGTMQDGGSGGNQQGGGRGASGPGGLDGGKGGGGGGIGGPMGMGPRPGSITYGGNSNAMMGMGIGMGGGSRLGMPAMKHGGGGMGGPNPMNNHYNNHMVPLHNNNYPGNNLHPHHNVPPPPDQVITQNGVKLHRK